MVTANELRNILKKKISMKQLTPQQMEAFKSAEKCQVCEKLFKDTDKRVRDHYHLTGGYRGPAHNTASIHWKWKSHVLFTISDHTMHF